MPDRRTLQSARRREADGPAPANQAARPLATIAVPTFNRLDMLIRAVRSAQAQDYPAVEIVILDNASNDGTRAYGEAVAASDPRVRYVRHPANLGFAANFNSGLDEAHGSFFMWLADDDWLDPDFLSRCVEAFDDDPRLVLVAAINGYYRGNHFELSGEEIDVLGETAFERVSTYYRNFGHNGAFYGLARTEAVRRVTPFRYRLAEDWLITGRLVALGGLRTIRTTRLHRTMGGASADLYDLGRAGGLGHWRARFPFLTSSAFIAEDIRTHEVFSVMTPATRWKLSLLVQARFLAKVARNQVVHQVRRNSVSAVAAVLGPEVAARTKARYRSWRPRPGGPTDGLFRSSREAV